MLNVMFSMHVSFISENFLALVGNSIITNELFNYAMAFLWYMHHGWKKT